MVVFANIHLPHKLQAYHGTSGTHKTCRVITLLSLTWKSASRVSPSASDALYSCPPILAAVFRAFCRENRENRKNITVSLEGGRRSETIFKYIHSVVRIHITYFLDQVCFWSFFSLFWCSSINPSDCRHSFFILLQLFFFSLFLQSTFSLSLQSTFSLSLSSVYLQLSLSSVYL